MFRVQSRQDVSVKTKFQIPSYGQVNTKVPKNLKNPLLKFEMNAVSGGYRKNQQSPASDKNKQPIALNKALVMTQTSLKSENSYLGRQLRLLAGLP